MSSYVVEDKCINSIVTWLAGPRHEWERRQVEEALAEQGTIGSTFEEKLGNAMFELNCNAVEQRYGDGQAKEFRDLDYAYVPNHLDSGWAAYDRCGEWIYQCSEGNVPEGKLFKAIQFVYDHMAHTFFRDLRERKQDSDNAVRLDLMQRMTVLEQKIRKTR